MKKTLAIVLALVMVLCMMPAMSAAVTENKTITDKAYGLAIESVGSEVAGASAADANSITFEYDYEALKDDMTGKFTADKKMAIVAVAGFDAAIPDDAKVTVDGKELKVDALADYTVGFAGGVVTFPVELTKAGYTDTFLLQVSKTEDGKTITETAKISVKLVNTAEYKVGKTATIADITSNTDDVTAYIVGSKIYLDYVYNVSDAKVAIAFKNEKGVAFSDVTWCYYPDSDNGAIELSNGHEKKLNDKSAVEYVIYAGAEGTVDTDVVFKLETASAIYETKEYDIVAREGIVEDDPKGIYFAEATKTIAMGESFKPVVMGVETGRKVAATIVYGDNTSKEVIDVEDGETVVGTRLGTAYIQAQYQAAGQPVLYTSSSMKIVVVDGASIPPVAKNETYYVTCRNLNVRKGPSTSYGKAGMIHRGDAVEVVSVANGWAKLANGTYVCAKYISK